MKRFARIPAWTLTALLALTTSLRAGSLDDRVPQNSLVYVGWAGADALQAQYANSNLKAFIDASAIKDFVAQQIPRLIGQATGGDPTAAKKAEVMQTLLGAIWRHPSAFYFCPMDLTNPESPVPHMGFVVDAGADTKILSDFINGLLTENPPPPEMPVHLLQDGNVLILTFGKADTAADLKQGGGLANSAAYKAAMAGVKQPNPAITVYGDVKSTIAMINDALAKTPNAPPEVKEKVPAIIDLLGLNGLTQFSAVAGFDGKGWQSQSFVGITGPHKGLLSLLDAAPITDTSLAVVPKDAAAFSVWKMDPAKLFTEARNIVGKIDPDTLKELDSSIADLSKQMNVDIEKELIDTLGDEWTVYRAPIGEEGGNSFAFVHKLKDPATFAKSLDTLQNYYNTQMQQAMFKAEKVTTSKIEVSTIALGQMSVAWTVRNGYLYVSSLDGIAGAVKQVENKSPSIAESDLYKNARAALPAGIKPITLAYSNPAKLYPELRRTVLGYLPIIRQFGIDVPKELLPDAADVAPYMTPGAAVAWVDGTGLHAVSRSAFPGAAAMSGQQIGPAALALGAAVALPALAHFRVNAAAAPRNVDMANLRGIAQSTIIYASDHADQFPDDLARLVADGLLSPRQLISRRGGTAALELTPELQQLAKDDFSKFSTQLADHDDFVYLGRGTKMTSDSAVVLAYEKPGPQTRDGISIAFCDGHVEFVRWNSAAKVFSATNDNLRKNGQNPVNVRDLMKKAGVADEAGLP